MRNLTSPLRRLIARICSPGVIAGTASTSLVFTYDRENDLLLARFGAPEDADTIVVEPDVTVRISRRTGQPVAIEVIDCAAKFRKQPAAITAAFARELLARYGQEARRRIANAQLPRAALA